MLKRRFEKLLIRPEDVVPSGDDLEVIGAFNPGAVEVDGLLRLTFTSHLQVFHSRDGRAIDGVGERFVPAGDCEASLNQKLRD